MTNLPWKRPLPHIAVLVLACLGTQFAHANDRIESRRPPNIETVRFDIAENGFRFSFDDRPVHDNGSPAYGNEFITEGYIYQPGTLNNSSNGVNPDGSPEFPDRVIGRWSARGWHVGNGGKTTEGPWVVTTQIFDFGPEVGIRSIVTDGYETPEINKPIKRAITGRSLETVGADDDEERASALARNESSVIVRVTHGH